MSFKDYSDVPAQNTTIGDNIFIGPNMERAKVRPSLQQLAADGRALRDEMLALGGGGTLPAFIQSGADAVERPVQDKLRDIVSIADFLPAGFVTTGGVNYTSHIQAAMDAAAAQGRTLQSIPGIFDVSGTGLVPPAGLQWVGAGQDATIIRNLNGNVLRLSGARFKFTDLTLYSAAGGHTVLQTGSVNRSTFDRVSIQQDANGYSQWNNANHPFIANLFKDCYFDHLETATVPGFDLLANGGVINNNRWIDCWVQESGNYAFRIDSSDINAQYGNIFSGIIFEICSGGGIQLKANKGFIIDDCHCWDVDDSSAYTAPNKNVKRDFYSILLNASNATSYGRITNCQRLASVLNAGIYDVRLPAGGGGGGTIIENCTTVGGGDPFLIEDASNFIYAIVPNTLCQLAGGANAMSLDPFSGSFGVVGYLAVDGQQVIEERKTGWSVDTGTAKRTANATYTVGSALTVSNPPTQAEMQAVVARQVLLENAVRDQSQKMKALIDDLHATAGHGLIGA